MAEFCDFPGYNSDFVHRPLLKKGALPEIAKQPHSPAGRKCNHHTSIARFATTFLRLWAYPKKNPVGDRKRPSPTGQQMPPLYMNYPTESQDFLACLVFLKNS